MDMTLDTILIDNFVMNFLSRYKYPSISLGIIDHDNTYLRGYGFRDIKKALPADQYTLYGIGSITKSFTALSIMQLYEKGLLDINDPVSKYVDIDIELIRDHGITIHHLLTHTSGVPALGYAEAYIDGLLGLTDEWIPLIKPYEVIEFMDQAYKWRSSKPGEAFYYLNEGYVILGYIISKVSGLSYVEYVDKNILEPLKMDKSYFKREDIEKDGNLATPYVFDNEDRPIESSFPFGITSDGGLVSNVVDMLKYIKMYLNRGVSDNTKIISKESIEKMETGYITLPSQVFKGESYGYGLMIIPDFLGYKLIGHSGSILVHTAYIGYIPEKHLGIILLSNGGRYRLSYLGMAILAILLDKDPSRLPFISYENVLERLEGVYHAYKNTMKVYVEKKGSIIYLKFRNRYGEEVIPLIPLKIKEDKAIFLTNQMWREYKVEFILSKDHIELYYERYKFIKSFK